MLKRVGNYILEHKIGSGSFGEVYQGHNETNGQRVSIKVMERSLLTGKFTELFKDEVKILKSCQCNNIIQLYDVKKTTNNIYFVYEYCNEGDMDAYLGKKGHLTEEEAVKYFLEILNGFKVLVKNNVVHRDFKLSNLLKHEGSVKISDFGFSKLLGKWDMTQTVIGTPLNMAPEIIRGSSYNNKVDIWSLGIVFYQMLFGMPPYIGLNIFEILYEIQSKDLKFPREINDISPETEDILKRMLNPDPYERIEWKDIFQHRINSHPKKIAFIKMQNSLDAYNFRKAFCLSSSLYLPYVVQGVNAQSIQVGKGRQDQEQAQQEKAYYKEETASTQGTEKLLSNSSLVSMVKFF